MKMDGSINCAREGCSKIASDLQCPVCQKNGLASKESSHFCSQECFRSAWASHKLLHLDNKNKEVTFNPWPNYKYTGSLRPYPYGPKRTITKGMRGGPDGKGPVVVRPDYADSGIPKSEMTAKSSNTIPVFLSNEEQDGIRIVCRIAREVLDVAAKLIRVGATGEDIDKVVYEECIKRGAYPSPLNYQGFPRSCCVSVNEVICHGIPDTRPFAVGDIVNIDVTLYYGGYHGDLNDSYIVADLSNESGSQYLGIANTGISDIKSSIENEKKSPSFIESVRLVECARECLRLALCEVYPGKPFRELGNVIDAHAKSCGFSVVRNFCGHGIGRVFHGAPMIPHYANNKASGVMRVGNVFTIEPMINAGNWRDTIWPDNWTAVTVDGSRSAQFEHTILVTSTGCEVLTAASGEKRYYSSLSFSS